MNHTDRPTSPPAAPTPTPSTSTAKPADVGLPRDDSGPGAHTTLEGFRAELRGYMVERFRADEITRAELNHFLRRFGLPTCDAPIRVHYTLTGHVDIDVAAGDGVDRATFAVGVDLTGIDLFVDGSDVHDGVVKVYPSAPVGVVLYTVWGHYDVTTPDPAYAATEANSYLYPDLSELVGVREGSDHCDVHVRTDIR